MAAYKKRNSRASAAVIAVAVLVMIVAVVLALVFGGEGGGGVLSHIKDDILGEGGTQNGSAVDMIDSSQLPDATTPVVETSETGTTVITLSDSGITIDGNGALAEGSYLKIVKGGTYSLSGSLTDGRIAVRAKGEDVVLILNGVNVTCSNSAPLYVNKAASVTLLLNGTSENTFTDGTAYDYTLEYGSAVEEEPNACVFSKADLIIRGTGSLKVNANYNSGIISKDTLKIINTTVDVSAKNNGVNGKDSLTIQNSTVRVSAGGDALRATQENDPSLGWADISNSNIYLASAEGDCIQTETGVTLTDCSVSIKSGAEGSKTEVVSSSAKGIKVNQGGVTLNGGTLVLDTADDAFHSAGDINVLGGNISVSTGDDALHSDADIYISGGVLSIPLSHEGLEGALVEISGGEVYIIADDDGINAAGGNDESSSDIKGMFTSDGSYLGITGGFVYINSQGDGIDSNGDIYMSGGTLIISGPERDGDGAIDYTGDFHVDGGLMFAAGSAGMAQAPDNMTVNTISVTFDKVLNAGTYICVEGGGKQFVFCLEKTAQNVVFSSPEITAGEVYTVSYGGKYSGEVSYCVGSGGKYSGGTELGEVTVAEGLNTYGNVGIGGSLGGGRFGDPGRFGGMGGEGHQNPFGGRGGQGGNPPEGMPDDVAGDPPELPEGMPEPPEGMPEPPDGQIPGEE